MTEAYEDSVLVRVRAQAMCRDEGTGGWLALGGGGLANVRLGKRPVGRGEAQDEARPRPPAFEYYIHGVRISDETEVLSCTIHRDFQYNKVMPTFHHWVTGARRFGLTFQTAADARAFDRGVRAAVEELLDGLDGAWPSLHTYKQHNPGPKSDDEENIFECLNLPSDSRSSSEASSGSRRRETPILSAITLPRHLDTSLKQYRPGDEDRCTVDAGDQCSYVHLSAVHEYQYPTVGAASAESSPRGPSLDRQSSGTLKADPPPLPDKKPPRPEMSRLKCRHCHEWYIESANRAGACEFAPDACATCVHRASCMSCAQGLLYHCMSDSEGDFTMHPCACAPSSGACYKRWFCVGMLSIVVPCLWCYIPLHCIHRAARALRVSGALHSPEPRSPS